MYHLATRNSGEEDCAWNLPEVQASRNLVDWLKKIQNGPELVYASSFSAINAGPEGSVLSYSEAKKVGETICREYDRTRIVRLGNVYGDEKGVVDSIIQTARDEGKITVHGDGSQKRPFISIKDATRSLKKSKRRTVNAHEEVYTIKAVAEKVTEVFNAEINLRKEVETSNVEPPASNFQTKNSLGEYIEDKKE